MSTIERFCLILVNFFHLLLASATGFNELASEELRFGLAK
jgi:hypothetical protein